MDRPTGETKEGNDACEGAVTTGVEAFPAASAAPVGLLGFPVPVWIILGVEFAERMGYYAVSFSLFTYCTHMLGTGPVVAAAIINGLYVVIPAAACVASGLADGRWGRPRTLSTFLCVYCVGLMLLAASSLPVMYAYFPESPGVVSWLLFSFSLVCFSVGYGGMKVCTNPMMADSISQGYRPADTDNGSSASESFPAREAHHGGADHPQNSPLTAAAILVDGEGTAPASLSEQLEEDLSRAFRVIYWVTNMGSLIGIFVAPLLRGLDHRRVSIGGVEYTVGYYFGFFMAACCVVVGLVLFLAGRHRFVRNPPTPSFVFFHLVFRAVKVRLMFATGILRDEPSYQALRAQSQWLAYGTYAPNRHSDGPVFVAAEDAVSDEGPRAPPREAGTPLEAPGASNVLPIFSDIDQAALYPGLVDDSHQTLRVCRAFVALPIYWLITNQFSSSLMYSVEALDLPDLLPPDLFNNINTITLLLFLAAIERWGFPAWWGGGRTPSTRSRVCLGFALMILSMVWCGAVQVAITHNGYYDHTEAYTLFPGQQRLSGLWLVFPYILQGVAAALVDPATMEIAYTAAPDRMKGTVMGLYWVASSLSGFLGLALSPVMRPQNAVALYFSFASSLVLVTALFYALNGPGAYRNIALQQLDGAVQPPTSSDRGGDSV